MCLKANAEMVPKFPSWHYMLLMWPSLSKIISSVITATGWQPICSKQFFFFFGKTFIEHKMCFWLPLLILSETFLILRREWDTIINIHKGKGEGKANPRTGLEGPEGEPRYSFTLSLTSVLDGVRWSTSRTAALPPGNSWYPLYRRLGGPQDRSGRVRKISLPPGFDPRTFQPVASLYTDWAIPAPPCILRYPNVHHPVYNSPPPVPNEHTPSHCITIM
jgi:hypothetical protein